MSEQVKVSIVIAAYNAEKYILSTMTSILEQTYNSFEIIVVVNCSDDKTLGILHGIKDDRIKIFQTDICQLAFNLNYGLLKSCGEYIVRIDADDIAVENRIQQQLEVAQKHGYDVIGSNIIYIDENSQYIGEKFLPEKDADIRKQLWYSNPFVHPSMMYKKSVVMKIGGYLNGRMSEDYDLWLRLSRDKNIKFYNIQKSLTQYRIHDAQVRGNKRAYAEVAGFMLREALFQKSLKFFLGTIVHITKYFLK
jgi:O86/O127-antigen biosynthesis beta-1,3-galactosyltransferase